MPLKRKNTAVKAIMAGALVTMLAGPCAAALPSHDVSGEPLPSLAPMLEQTTPAVVNIATLSIVQVADNPLLNDPFFRRFFGSPKQQKPRHKRAQSLGSGVIVDAQNGYVLTNSHVINKADEIAVTLRDGRVVEAELVGADPETDVAVIQIPAEGLQELPFADSDELRVGDFVVAIGNPFGLGQTVTSGIVSALGRSGLGLEGYEDFIQTDASINPGNSGGALVNLRGELVGINTAIVAPGGGNVGIGFAIPTNMANELMEQLIEYGEIRRGRLGLSGQTLTADMAKIFSVEIDEGVLVASVEPGAAAERADLRVGDVIVAINEKAVTNTKDLRNALGLLRAGSEVRLDVVREGKPVTITAEIEAPEELLFEGRRVAEQFEGAKFGAITKSSKWHGKLTGLLVYAVDPGSNAWLSGLREGDVIVSVNRQSVTTKREMEAALKLSSENILLNIRRGNRALFTVVQ